MPGLTARGGVAVALTIALIGGCDSSDRTTRIDLQLRPTNTTCIAPDRPAPALGVTLEREFTNLAFDDPVGLLQAPGDGSRWFVIERRGYVRVFPNDPNVTQDQVTTFLDLSDRISADLYQIDWETGLLGLAFHPDFKTNGRFFVHYTGPTIGPGYSEGIRISEFTSKDGLTSNPATERELIVAYKLYSWHNGGQLAFGPDGYLYATVGEGAFDPNSQRTDNLFGKILRIDVDQTEGYGIPADNPFAGSTQCSVSYTPEHPSAPRSESCPEIYAFGLRNPWRFSFDRAGDASDLWVADVGGGLFEEINIVTAPGGNFGWSIREGLMCAGGTADCASTSNGVPLTPPVQQIPHPEMNAIVGGYVYRGSALTSLTGNYIFANFAPGVVYALFPDSAGGFERQQLSITNLQISSFAEDQAGEIHLVDRLDGGIYGLTQTEGGVDTIPDSLVDTGCVNPSDPTLPARGLIPFAPNAPFWSSSADKERWMALPDGSSITVESDGDWTFPIGTVLVKHFRLDKQLVETRLLVRHTDGDWAGYTYQWNDSQTAATRVRGGATATFGDHKWIYPSEAECLACHTKAAGGSLGVETSQLNGELLYRQVRSANQIAYLKNIGILPATLPDANQLPALPNPYDARSGSVTARARAYLHVNCSQCHRPDGGTPVDMDLRFTASPEAMNVCNVAATRGDLGVSGALRIHPADPSRSMIYIRMQRTDAHAMPPIGKTEVDAEGTALIEQWIQHMDGNCH